ncbi:PREDICTED: carboxymethylenebutenolidase homolog [Tarenaya hassleriana]|uniref:carboxymethylenebutenolidase homolog n=1 Tax=Tarenaya hassleriana TaxID=28532 RepID=UPI00053CA7F1|nr:PREDICTED: carboxymethylenebutenolidase homolog [Tarenaya hassleriana]
MAASLPSLSSAVTEAVSSAPPPLLSRRSLHNRRLLPPHATPLRSPMKHVASSSMKKSAFHVSDGAVNVDAEVEEEACELVNGVELSIDGVEAYLLRAVKNNNRTGLLLLSDIFGFQDSSTRDFAYRIACNGYNVLVPDLFCGDPWTKNRPRSTFEQWRELQDPNRIQQDITACTKWMVDEFAAAGISNKLGLIGFCFGGGRVVDVLASDQYAFFSTGVSFYGTRMDLAAAENVKVPVLFVTGDRDPLCEVEGLYEMERKIGKGSKTVVFEGRGHGFVHRPETPEDDRDAEEAFAVMRNWLHEKLLCLVNNE